MTETPEQLAEKVRAGLPYNLGPGDERVPEAYSALDALLAEAKHWKAEYRESEKARAVVEVRLAEAEEQMRLVMRDLDRAQADRPGAEAVSESAIVPITLTSEDRIVGHLELHPNTTVAEKRIEVPLRNLGAGGVLWPESGELANAIRAEYRALLARLAEEKKTSDGLYLAVQMVEKARADAEARLAEAEKELSTTKVERDAWLVAAKANGDDCAAAEARLAEAESANRTGFYYKKWAAAEARLAEAEKANVGLSCSITELGEERDRYRDALERIAKRGPVFDAKGTWSKEVCSIARAALDPEQKS